MEVMMTTLDEGEKAKADAKAAVRFLKERARTLSDAMAKNFTNGHHTLAAGDAKMLAEVMAVLGQIDVNS